MWLKHGKLANPSLGKIQWEDSGYICWEETMAKNGVAGTAVTFWMHIHVPDIIMLTHVPDIIMLSHVPESIMLTHVPDCIMLTHVTDSIMLYMHFYQSFMKTLWCGCHHWTHFPGAVIKTTFESRNPVRYWTRPNGSLSWNGHRKQCCVDAE